VEPAPAAEPAAPTPLDLDVVDEPADEPEADVSAQTELHRNFAGSVQLDYMTVPTESRGRDLGFDGATVEASLKLAMDFSDNISASVKVCVACHGFEVGMAFFDLRVADQLNIRVGRFSPAFGEFPLRHDPANHRTSDKPLPYDMGRMLRMTEWNQGVLPAPWVENGIEINGTQFAGNHVQIDYAAYAIGGPRAGADPLDFDFRASRSGESYYIDNNSRPSFGGQAVVTLLAGSTSLALGGSVMRGTYDPEHEHRFAIYGAHAVLRARDVFLRVEYLRRLTEMALGDNPAERFRYGPGADGMYDPYFVKEGAYAEVEVPLGRRISAVLREDGMRRRGNVSMSSALRSDSAVIRHTAGLAVLLRASLRLKLSYEYYDFSDFSDESAVHIGIAGPF
ncbi:MAG: hypothetical protein K8M05_04310, partial [Deltaproteobacteria bacterium]|nr:hypothetical protein [Kofleriaceae bacterium]